jgi:hypothetical protein
MARMAEWFGSGDRLLSILESQEAKSVAKLLGHDVEQQISVYLRRCQQVARKPN